MPKQPASEATIVFFFFPQIPCFVLFVCFFFFCFFVFGWVLLLLLFFVLFCFVFVLFLFLFCFVLFCFVKWTFSPFKVCLCLWYPCVQWSSRYLLSFSPFKGEYAFGGSKNENFKLKLRKKLPLYCFLFDNNRSFRSKVMVENVTSRTEMCYSISFVFSLAADSMI